MTKETELGKKKIQNQNEKNRTGKKNKNRTINEIELETNTVVDHRTCSCRQQRGDEIQKEGKQNKKLKKGQRANDQIVKVRVKTGVYQFTDVFGFFWSEPVD